MPKRPYSERLHHSNPIHRLARDRFFEQREASKRKAGERSDGTLAVKVIPDDVTEANGFTKWENDLIRRIVAHE